MRLYRLASSLLLLVACPPLFANVNFTGSYTQNFNGMALGTATPADWFVGGLTGVDGAVDANGNGAITGTAVQVDNGSISAGSGTIGNYNYGATGDSASRSLGSIATTSRGNRAMEVRLTNQTGSSIGSFSVHYDGKQWRLENTGDQVLVMKYSTDGINFVTMGAPFDFHSIQDTGTAGALDGNTVRLNGIGGAYTPANPIPVGGSFYLRWYDFNDASVSDQGLAIDNVVIDNPVAASGTSLSFQDGLSGYTGTVDTFLQQVSPGTNNGAVSPFKWDGEDGGGFDYALVRFDGLFGTGTGQIKPTDVITSASLVFTVSDAGNSGTVHEAMVSWTEAETFNSFGGEPDVQADEYGSAISSMGSALGSQAADVTASLIAWQASIDPNAANRGWIIRPTGTDGVQVRSREYATTPAERPRLVVVVNGGAPAQRTLQIYYPPYLQLGNAPLVATGPGIGATDQIVIAWQTTEAGSGNAPDDYFEVEYRAVGAGSYTPVTPVSTLNIGEGTRVNRSVLITGLNYDADYEYRVFHKRNPSTPVLVNTYNGSFHTRKHPTSLASFSFAAYGDSANINSPGEQAQFESVVARLSLLQSAFVVLLGDNIYNSGTHPEMDARFRPSVAPNNSAYLRNHIEYFCMGNHDAGFANGQASLDDYYCPVPVLNVTSPVSTPAGETAEKNYSFDYGLIHFTIIDSTAWGGPGNTTARQAAIVTWMSADLAASQQPWKIVAAHHPPKSYFSHTDTGEGMGCEVFPAMIANGGDLLLVGHSHDYQRSFPITGHTGAPGCSGGDVTWIADQSGAYTKGAQTIQIIAGMGGENIDGPAPTTATQWVAKAFGNNNGGVNGPFIIDVTATQLVCKYVSAVDGSIKDQFTISIPGPTIGVNPASLTRSAFIGASPSNDTFTVRNAGTGSITYSIDDNVDWLSVAPTTGDSTGEPDTITVTYSTGALAFGPHNATITITSPEAVNSPKTIPVTLNVTTVRPDFDQDGDVDQSDFSFLQNCFTGAAITVTGDCARADINATPDTHVDSGDLTVFLGCMSGADIMAISNCAG